MILLHLRIQTWEHLFNQVKVVIPVYFYMFINFGIVYVCLFRNLVVSFS